ncbi:M14 family metallopeptidase [Psychroserpens ponticola]|uniref:Succinylglutamate desuccinylase/aspartoacylase family protein n=1 Tax=Psychroserpens ponticola TaxID=2932268 RepID=A0ABY7RUA2_9FLAO|nr:succinylglutamate desuccinylase/aspartoacylase family protein [Psychroserpens ponticola]WCO00700.1 succinylglutamate desuccinylase/aspartoacylase family protein [Psychroserpens ponticola]
MIKESAKPKTYITEDRIFYSQNNDVNGITLICIGGIHGNEPAGVYGLQKVISDIIVNDIKFKGNFYALLGNMNALQSGVRYKDFDLNRLWTTYEIESLRDDNQYEFDEQKEQYELYTTIKEICNSNHGDFVFIDLHTTSSPTVPFITISDSLNNRSLADKFHIPIVLGIEEYLDGPLLSYINEFGHVSLGFEAGQHDDEKSVLYCEAFIWLVMEKLGLTSKNKFDYKRLSRVLNFNKGFYEIIYRHALSEMNQFKMKPGFINFKPVLKYQTLANEDVREVKSAFNGLIFMPLYQKQGEDGFFIVRKLSKFWLLFSVILRNLKCHQFLRLLPGIKKHPNNDYCLIANRRITLFLTTKIFHLFGYRKKVIIEDKIHFMKRDRKVIPFI